jgi:hypothetical protein
MLTQNALPEYYLHNLKEFINLNKDKEGNRAIKKDVKL